jgi:hypothetical protein
VLLVLAASIAASCQATNPSSNPPPASPQVVEKSVSLTPTHRWPDIYAHAIHAATTRHLHVWLGSDLDVRWLEGKQSFEAAVRRLAELARMPGVVGIKIADELGYEDGFNGDAARVRAFLRDSARALHRLAPGKKILIDLLVPELGCAPGIAGPAAGLAAACAAERRARNPALTLPDVDALFAMHAVDVVDLSTGLLSPDAYRDWGITIDDAQVMAWREAMRRGWGAEATLQARKALAFAGTYPYGAAQAEDDLRLYVDIPSRMGAAATDIWTWRQPYEGQVVHLVNPGIKANPLWRGLVARKRAGARLFTHFTPSSMEEGLHPDLDAVAQAFTSVFMAAGTG